MNRFRLMGVLLCRNGIIRERVKQNPKLLMALCSKFSFVIIKNNNKTFFALLNNLSTDKFFFSQLSKVENGLEFGQRKNPDFMSAYRTIETTAECFPQRVRKYTISMFYARTFDQTIKITSK